MRDVDDLNAVIHHWDIEQTKLKALADQGNPHALYMMSFLHKDGYNRVQVSDKAAAEYARRGAEQGHFFSMAAYGLALYMGDGVAEDDQKGTELCRKAIPFLTAATHLSRPYAAHAQNLLGLINLTNVSNDAPDIGYAIDLLGSASSINPAAQYNLAVCYGLGINLSSYHRGILDLLTRAAEYDHANAQFSLGQHHPREPKRRHYRDLAAAQGVHEPRKVLGIT